MWFFFGRVYGIRFKCPRILRLCLEVPNESNYLEIWANCFTLIPSTHTKGLWWKYQFILKQHSALQNNLKISQDKSLQWFVWTGRQASSYPWAKKKRVRAPKLGAELHDEHGQSPHVSILFTMLPPVVYTLRSSHHVVPQHCLFGVGLDLTSPQPPWVQTRHCLPPAISFVPPVSRLCLQCHILLIQLYMFLTHTFIVKINAFLEEESNIMSTTFIYSSCQMVLWGFSFF